LPDPIKISVRGVAALEIDLNFLKKMNAQCCEMLEMNLIAFLPHFRQHPPSWHLNRRRHSLPRQNPASGRPLQPSSVSLKSFLTKIQLSGVRVKSKQWNCKTLSSKERCAKERILFGGALLI
jgi:hypothetical protein